MKTKISIVMLVLGCLIAMSVYAAEEDTIQPAVASETSPAAATDEATAISIETEMEKISYIIGTQMAASIRQAKIDVSAEAVAQGLKDALAGKKPPMSQTEMKTVYDAWLKRRKEEQAAEKAKAAAENLAKGNAFLEANKAKEGVTTLPSGLQYKVITEGTGNTPVATDKVKTHYRGTLIDGKEFDSSYKRNQPATFGVTQVIKGWVEALQLMKEGAKWELYIPANLAYGTRDTPTIPANSTLIFEIELLEIVKPEPAEAVK